MCGNVATKAMTKGYIKNYFKDKYGNKFGVVSSRSPFFKLLQQFFDFLDKTFAVTGLKKMNFDDSNKPLIEVLYLYLTHVFLLI